MNVRSLSQRVIALLLSFVLLTGMLPVGAMAAEDQGNVTQVVEETSAPAAAAVELDSDAPTETTVPATTEAEPDSETAPADPKAAKTEEDQKPGKGAAKKPGKDKKTEATEPSTEATEPSTKATEPATEATEPSTKATEPSTKATEPSTKATEPSTKATEPSTEVTEPSTEATEPSTEATEPDVIAVTGITLDQTALEVGVGELPITLTATVLPEDATDKTVTWTSSNPDVAFVEAGVVQFGMMGEAVITAAAGEFSASCTVIVGEGEWTDYAGTTYVLAASDFQNKSGDSAGAATVESILSAIKDAGYDTMHGFLFGGDLSQSLSTSASASGKTALQGAVQGVYGTNMDEIYVQGNHDPDDTVGSTCTTSGEHDTDAYGVYVINEKDYPWGYYESSSSSSYKATVQATADALDAYLDAKVAAEYSKPIFVTSHIPLHYTTRTSSQRDAMHANLLFDVLNEGGANGLNIIFLFGHNHSTAYDSYLGQGAIYLAEGDKIHIAQNSTSTYEEETLNFTYMNYGYVGYIGSTDADAALTMTVFEITDEQVVVKRYSEDGVHDLKAAGGSTSKPSGISANSTVYSSPQTIELNQFTPAAALTGITVTAPAKTAYVVGDELDTTGMVVTASYDDGTTKEVTADSVSADLTSAGTKTVTVTYKEMTATFEITVYAPVEDETTGVTVAAPGVTGLTVTKITEEVPADRDYAAYVSYDITPVGYTQGVSAAVTVPVPDSFDASKPVQVLDNGSVLTTTTINNGTVTFTATHFSVYEIVQTGDVVSEWKEIPAGTIYKLDTDGVSTGEDYLIVSTGTDGTAQALRNNDGSVDSAEVTISNGQIITNATDIVWTYDSSKYISNGSHYFYLSYNNTTTFLSSSKQRAMAITSNDAGEGAYTVKRDGSYYNYYLNYDESDGWTNGGSADDIYFFVKAGTGSGGYAGMTGATVYNVTTGTTTEEKLLEEIRNNLLVYTATDASGTGAAPTDEYSISGTADPDTAGTYTYTVTYGGVELGTVTVNVVDKKISTVIVNNASGSVSKGASQRAETGAMLTVTYEDGSTLEMPVTVSMLSKDGASVSTASEGEQTGLTLTYNGTVVTNNFTLTVNPKAGNNYPDYPNEGAVKVEKTATGIDFQASGVATVELSAKGIPMNQGVDVLLILDTSSSMGFQGSLTDANATRLSVLQECVDALIQNLKTPREDGSLPDVDMAIVDFNGYVGDKSVNYISSTAKSTTSVGSTLLDWTSVQNVDDNWGTTEGNIPEKSGTNYDHGLQQGYELLLQKQTDEPGRKQFVLFMSDGAPFQYNGVNSNSVGDDWEQWILGSYTQEEVEAITTITNHEFYYGNNDGNGQKHRYAEAIKGSSDDTFQVVYFNGTSSSATASLETVYGLGATMYSVGLALEATNMPTDVAGQEAILKTIASSEDVFYSVTSAAGLQDAFDDFAGAVLLAATNARFVDQMGPMYDLQLGNISYLPTGVTNEANKKTIEQKIEVISYDIYTREEVVNGNLDLEMIGDRKGTSTTLETVTFNENGTAAYSDGDTTNNILVDGVICAKTFYYNTSAEAKTVNGITVGAETFHWIIGDLKSTEMAIRYNVYLTKALGEDGGRPAGSYATNTSAVLYYDNYLGNACKKETVSPTMAWKGANVSYAFYLVDASSGKPVNNNGSEVPFSERTVIVNPTLEKQINLNTIVGETEAMTIAASGVLPAGYWLYDEAAVYSVDVNSNGTGGWTITNGTNLSNQNSTYVTDYSGDAYTYATSANSETNPGYDFTHTVVWFAVKWEPRTVNDTVVIDFGLPVDVHVLANDLFGDYGKLIGVTKGTVANNTDDSDGSILGDAVNQIPASAEPAAGDYGTATVSVPATGYTKDNSLIRYEPTTMSMNGKDVFSYSVQYANPVLADNNGFYYGQLTVIPATTIYYEDEFVDLSSYTWSYDTNDWVEKTESGWTVVTDETYVEDEDITQAEDRPDDVNYAFDTVIDANNIYGYDGAYDECSQYSLGSAVKANVDYDNYAEASFSFYGTGFDVVSLSSNQTGAIYVEVDDANGNRVRDLAVDTYYGMNEDGTLVENDPSALYQVPVIEVSGLTYGKYNVTIKAVYSEIFDHEQYSDNTYDFYLDAIRIYDPAGTPEDDTIEDAYKADEEGWPVYEEVRDNVISAAELEGSTELPGIVFIDSADEVATVADYTDLGPNNELYLAANQAIAFQLDLSGYDVAAVHLGIKSAAGDTVSYKVFNGNENLDKEAIDALPANSIETSTGMYYDITALKDGVIVIYNAGTGMLSVTDIKITFNANPGVVENLFYTSAATINKLVENMNKTPEEEVTAPETFEVTAPETTVVGSRITVKVTTSADVDAVSIDGTMVTRYSTDANGNRVWTARVSASESGTKGIVVNTYNSDGYQSATKTASVTVNSAEETVETIIRKIADLFKGWFGW